MTFEDGRWVVVHRIAAQPSDLVASRTLTGIVDARSGLVLEVRLDDAVQPDDGE